MGLYKKESLDLLRERVDLPELISGYISLKRVGTSFKALCPFHEEKTPSFVIQAGDHHYHCFGCGAHGDAIAFLMNHLRLSFVEAVEVLAERFGVSLEKTTEQLQKGPNKADYKEAVELACQIYQFWLLYSEEGHRALQYLYERGISLEFIQRFRIGYALARSDSLRRLMQKKRFSKQLLEEVGLLTKTGRDFFTERITFPICDAFGAVIGFSARKFKEHSFGGKYINTPDSPLFKKSQVLFGLHHSRLRIAKEKKILLVEGQIDALRLIEAGFDFTVAIQGTAFNEGHIRELIHLGVTQAFVAFDADEAGLQAASKVGTLLQKKTIAVSIVALPSGSDPDQLLREKGPKEFQKRLEEAEEYLSFYFQLLMKTHDLQIPAQKSALVKKVRTMIEQWEDPVMIHESLRKLSQLASIPEEMLTSIRKRSPILPHRLLGTKAQIDADRIIETDLLRWLILRGNEDPRLLEISNCNISLAHFRNGGCRHLYEWILKAAEEKCPFDLMALGSAVEMKEEQMLSEIVQKKVNMQKAEEGVIEAIERLLTRHWMEERETLRVAIQNSLHNEETLKPLIYQFDALKRNRPKVRLP